MKGILYFLIQVLGQITGCAVWWKPLPSNFQGAGVYVTSSANIRVLCPGMKKAFGDFLQVAELFVKPGHVIWDIGSNLGIFSIAAATMASKQGQVYSLEADTKYTELQARTVRRLSLSAAPVDVLCASVADRLGILKLVIPNRGHSRSHLSIVPGNQAGEEKFRKYVPALTLDSLLNCWRPPSLLKVDVESAEVLVLNGAKKILKEIRPIIYIECSQYNQKVMTKMLRQESYVIAKLETDGSLTYLNHCILNTLALPE